jgi:hypothetical protein
LGREGRNYGLTVNVAECVDPSDVTTDTVDATVTVPAVSVVDPVVAPPATATLVGAVESGADPDG